MTVVQALFKILSRCSCGHFASSDKVLKCLTFAVTADICCTFWRPLNIWTLEHLALEHSTSEHMNLWTFEHWTTWSHSQHLSLWTSKHQNIKAPEHLNIRTSEYKSHWTSENICDKELTLCRQERFGDCPGKHSRRSGARGSTAIVFSNDFHKMVLVKQTILYFSNHFYD